MLKTIFPSAKPSMRPRNLRRPWMGWCVVTRALRPLNRMKSASRVGSNSGGEVNWLIMSQYQFIFNFDSFVRCPYPTPDISLRRRQGGPGFRGVRLIFALIEQVPGIYTRWEDPATIR